MSWNSRYEEEYQVSLGRLLLRFNDLEMLVGNILEQLTLKLGVPHLYRQEEYLSQKIDRLGLALCAKPEWPKPDFNRLRRVNSIRNDLAHLFNDIIGIVRNTPAGKDVVQVVGAYPTAHKGRDLKLSDREAKAFESLLWLQLEEQLTPLLKHRDPSQRMKSSQGCRPR